MRIISWNVNGVRAWQKKGCIDWLTNESPDFFCIQETKAHPKQLSDQLKSPEGYISYFDHSKGRKGYSGVATYLKSKFENRVLKIEYGLGVDDLDQEGRLISVYLKDFVLINCYFPNGGSGPERLKYKLKFYDVFLKYVERIRKSGHAVIFCGDVNTAHKEIDLARPKENEKNTGFLPVERAWLDKGVTFGYIDTFRYFHPNQRNIYTYWDMKTFARDRNVGWRIDYFFISPDLKNSLKSCFILDSILGSDHCPLGIDITPD